MPPRKRPRRWVPMVQQAVLDPDDRAMSILCLTPHERDHAWKNWLLEKFPDLREDELAEGIEYFEIRRQEMLTGVMSKYMAMKTIVRRYRASARQAVDHLLEAQAQWALQTTPD